MAKQQPAKAINHSMDSLTVGQHQKLLVLWLMLTANPGPGQYQIDPMHVLDRWSEDIGPYVDQDLPNAQDAFKKWAGPGYQGTLSQVQTTLHSFISEEPPQWGGGGVCLFDYPTLLAMLKMIPD